MNNFKYSLFFFLITSIAYSQKYYDFNDLKYFIDLTLDEKKIIIEKEKELQLLQENKIPARFQILNSSLPTKIKQTTIMKKAFVSILELIK